MTVLFVNTKHTDNTFGSRGQIEIIEEGITNSFNMCTNIGHEIDCYIKKKYGLQGHTELGLKALLPSNSVIMGIFFTLFESVSSSVKWK